MLQHGHPANDLVSDLRDLAEEFADIRPSKHRLGTDDCGVLMAQNIVFDLEWLKFIGAQIECGVAQHAIQVEHNVQPFPLRQRHDCMLNPTPDLFLLL